LGEWPRGAALDWQRLAKDTVRRGPGWQPRDAWD